MIIIMRPGASDQDIERVVTSLRERGYGAHISRGVERTLIGAIGALDEEKAVVAQQLEAFASVERVLPILRPYKLVSLEAKPERTVIKVGPVSIGGRRVVVMAGPCSVESEQQVMATAHAVKAAGASILRGGAFKPSTSPYGFRGLQKEGLLLLRQAADAEGMMVVTEVMDPRDVALVSEYADILQIGTRNMTNFSLLSEVGASRKPVLLKRGMASTIEEWLQAAEYIMLEGNHQVILCERGIRTFETYTRNTVDISALPAVKELSHLPIVLDPSHGTGRAALVPAVARAAVAAGADGLLVEVHSNPEQALKDGPQSLRPEAFAALMQEVALLAQAVGREL